jgi:hypothetical protein
MESQQQLALFRLFRVILGGSEALLIQAFQLAFGTRVSFSLFSVYRSAAEQQSRPARVILVSSRRGVAWSRDWKKQDRNNVTSMPARRTDLS